MNKDVLVFERTYNAPLSKVWEAITNTDIMKKWYFEMNNFKPEVGCEFSFNGEKDGEIFVHLCKITEISENKKLSHIWKYKGYEGESLLTWELFEEGDKTRVKLTHKGLETFKVFTAEDFNGGWTYFINEALPEYLEVRNDFTISILTEKSPEEAFKTALNVRAWWSGLYGEKFEGESANIGDEFSYWAGEGAHYSKHKLIELVPKQKIVWLVTDSNLSSLEKTDEWNGTKMIFDISQNGLQTEVKFTHVGLVPEIECYDRCVPAWTQYIDKQLTKALNN